MNNQSLNTKKTRVFSAGLLLAGLFFLINPTVQMLDILPDFIGYFLIMIAIRPLAAALPAFDEVKDKLWRLIFLSLSQLAAVFVIVAVRGANTGERSIATVFSLVYLVLELLLVIPVFHELLRAFLSLSERHGVTAAGYVTLGSGLMRAENLLTVSILFHAVNAFFSFLPDICFLTFGDDTEIGAGLVLYPYYSQFLVVSVLIALLVGIFWYTMLVPYFRRLARDGELVSLFSESDALTPTVLQLNKRIYNRMRGGFFFLAAAVFLAVDPVLDGVNVFPDYLSAGAFLLGAFFLMPLFERKAFVRLPVIAAFLYGLSSIADYVAGTAFLTQFTVEDLGRKRLADQLYRIYMVSSVAKAVSFVLLAALMSVMLYRVFRALLLRTKESDDGSLTYSHRSLLSEYRVRLFRLSFFGVLVAILEAANVFLRRITEIVPVDDKVLGVDTIVISRFGTFWALPMFLTLLWTFLTYSIFSDFSEEIKKRYGLLE